MGRRNIRVRVREDGRIEIVDPGFDTLPLLQEIDPAFRARARTLPKFCAPRFQELRSWRAPRTSKPNADSLSLEALWAIHDAAMSMGNITTTSRPEDDLSLLDIKSAIAQRLLTACCLCARRCGVDRTRGDIGACGLAGGATVAEHFVHIAEEALINPSLVLNLRGCGLRCRFCQQHSLLDVGSQTGDPLVSGLWDRLDMRGARSLSFVGGNPDESVHAILAFLGTAPDGFTLPIVWNNHAYMSGEVIRLLEGVVDCYVPDFKYFDDRCAARLSGVRHYSDTARSTLQSLLRQDVPVIVRILVLPGHVECCHLPALRWLAQADQKGNCFVSVRGQYAPDWKITKRDGPLAQRVTRDETQMVVSAAQVLRLQLIH
ncbi:MAG: hypothetical protein K1X67_26725 [Fimbriimonadaceae bacterium]|nr:hypothetical protein [Fimbriimonadaceae bacterium]